MPVFVIKHNNVFRLFGQLKDGLSSERIVQILNTVHNANYLIFQSLNERSNS